MEHKDITIEDVESKLTQTEMEFVLEGARRYVDAVSELKSTPKEYEHRTNTGTA